MNTKLIAVLASGAAFLLVACSGNGDSEAAGGGNQAGAGSDTNSGNVGGSGPNRDGDGADQTPLQRANELYSLAQEATKEAVEAAQASRTEASRTNAERLIGLATMALARAVEAAEEAERTAAAGSAAQRSAALALYDARRLQTAWVQQDRDRARDSLAWYGRNLVRYELASGEAVEPRESVNTATVVRIPRTIPNVDNLPAPQVLTSQSFPQSLYTQIPNPKAFCQKSVFPETCEEDTFKTVMYEDGNRVFSVIDDGEGGDEFKVDGYVNRLSSGDRLDTRTHTGLKLTDGGLVIRTGGTAVLGTDAYTNADSGNLADFTDMRRDIRYRVSDTNGDNGVDSFADESPYDGIRGQNGWDLVITFDEPQTRSVPVDFDDISNPVSSWTGNNTFYWRAIAPADPSQLDEDGDYYHASAFNQPKGYRDLGTYEVWLSNHVGVDRKREPAPGRTATCPDRSRGTSCPNDDEHRYLKYAAYGLFVYTASTETFVIRGGIASGQHGRINTLHFGYSAFGTEEGQKTEDIGETITGGKFHGYALAYEVKGANASAPNIVETKLLRGDVSLTVNIPKESGRRGTVEGTINNFQQWNEENKYWIDYEEDDFKVALDRATIGEDGAFKANALATGATVADNFNPTGFNPTPGAGEYKGSFYGPRADANDLEIAGSWTVGTRTGTQLDPETKKFIFGSFGAKQRPPETPASD